MSQFESSLFVVDESAAGGGGNKVGSGLAAYPGEKPSKAELIKWLQASRDTFGTIGYGPFLRNEDPYEFAKLAPLPEESAAAGASAEVLAAIDSENRRIRRQNAINKIEYDARKKEIENRIASRLNASLRSTAPFKLKELQTKCGHVDSTGRISTESWNGVQMWKLLAAEETAGVTDFQADKYADQAELFRKSKLKDNASPDAFSKRINTYVVTINPYVDIPLEGARLSKFVISQLPECLAPDVRALKRELEATPSKLADVDYVTKECLALVEAAYKPSKSEATPAVVQAVLEGGTGLFAAATEEEDAAALRQKKIETAIAKLGQQQSVLLAEARKQHPGKPSGNPSGNDDKSKGGKGGGNRLLEGQKCSKGTCTFNHDKLKPGRSSTWQIS